MSFLLWSYLWSTLISSRGVLVRNLPEDLGLLLDIDSDTYYIEALATLTLPTVPVPDSDLYDVKDLLELLGVIGSPVNFASTFATGSYVKNSSATAKGIVARNCPSYKVLLIKEGYDYEFISQSSLTTATPSTSELPDVNELLTRLGFPTI